MEGQKAVGGIGRHPTPPPHQQPAAILLLGVAGMVDHPLAAAVVVGAKWEAVIIALTAADLVVASIPAAVPCRGCARVVCGGV